MTDGRKRYAVELEREAKDRQIAQLKRGDLGVVALDESTTGRAIPQAGRAVLLRKGSISPRPR